MRISIAMATYNGEKYLQEQLDSFLKQTCLPDELIVSDDCSNDNTVQILKNFTNYAPFEVKIYKNERNLGYAANFENALKQTSGNIIFLSDQDDVWFPNKIEYVIKIAQQNDQYLLYTNDAEICLADGTSTGLTKLGQTLSLGLSEKDFTAGCCMAIRKELKDIALPIPTKFYGHDHWLDKLSNILEAKKVIPSVLQLYRRHGENTSSWIVSCTKKQTLVDLIIYKLTYNGNPSLELDQLNSEIDALSAIINSPLITDSMREKINREIHECKVKELIRKKRLKIQAMPHIHRIRYVLRLLLLGDYKYYSGWQSAIKDLVSKSRSLGQPRKN
ncbi:glycosyltransferase family 2 protein [Thermosynechococcus sp. HN-54]|uniref:glycosyltransferase family 2 protein n=1 Tax=Thermosynechococcus sp. HN-54 TaxID=2933959 RepID=UPI00202CC52F|nr:glycosyltransferase family 2 protein [Thermosynechococcus sp. HN-54]URR35480.1 glycosyltransferase family 2 protein [Thermosynechococcus sp. HN-54]